MPSIGSNAIVITGMRRSGKTFRLYQEIADLLEAGVPAERICYFNFDDDRVQSGGADLISRVIETSFAMHPQARVEGAYVFFDELQDVEGWGTVTRHVVDDEGARHSARERARSHPRARSTFFMVSSQADGPACPEGCFAADEAQRVPRRARRARAWKPQAVGGWSAEGPQAAVDDAPPSGPASARDSHRSHNRNFNLGRRALRA